MTTSSTSAHPPRCKFPASKHHRLLLQHNTFLKHNISSPPTNPVESPKTSNTTNPATYILSVFVPRKLTLDVHFALQKAPREKSVTSNALACALHDVDSFLRREWFRWCCVEVGVDACVTGFWGGVAVEVFSGMGRRILGRVKKSWMLVLLC